MASLEEAREVKDFLLGLLDGPKVVGVGISGEGPHDYGVTISVTEEPSPDLVEHLTSAIPVPLTVNVTGPITAYLKD